MRATSVLVWALVALFSLSASAQTTPVRIRGTIENLYGQTLVVNGRDGGSAMIVTLDANFTVSAVVKKSFSDIKAGDFVASTSVKGTDGKLHALELHFLPESARATAEGQTPWDLAPDSLMTNAVVTGIAGTPGSQSIKVNYKGTDAEVFVQPDTPVVAYAPADVTALKPGAAVFIFAQKRADGGLSASRVTVEKDGVKPPM